MRGRPDVISDFSGGLNSEADPYALDINQARQVLNVTSPRRGTVRKRNGFRTLASPTLPIVSLFPFHGATDYLVAFGDNGASTDIYEITVGGTVTSRKGAATVSVSTRWDAIQAPAQGGQGPLYMMNGVDAPLQWTGSGNVASWTSTAGTLPNGRYCVYHDNRVFVAGVTSDPSTLYASALGNPRDWSTTEGWFTTFDPGDGEEITGLGTVGPYLLVFKPRKTFVVTDTDIGAYRNVSDEIGCVANRSIVGSDIGTFFLSNEHGIMLTNGTDITPVSDDIAPTLAPALSSATLANAAGKFLNGKYYLSINTGGSNDTILEFNTDQKSWWVHKIYLDSTTTTGVNDWAILNPGTDADLYAAGASTATPKVFKAFDTDLYVDRGGEATPVAYKSYWVTQWHAYGQPHLRKILRQLRVDAIGGLAVYLAKTFSVSETVQSGIDWESAEGSGSETFGGSGTYGGAGTFGEGALPVEHRYYTLGTARVWSFKFENNDTAEWELFSYTTAIDFRRD